MTDTQREILRALGLRSMTMADLADRTGWHPRTVARSLDAMFRRSWVTLTSQGEWCATERGRKRL